MLELGAWGTVFLMCLRRDVGMCLGCGSMMLRSVARWGSEDFGMCLHDWGMKMLE